MPKTTPEWNVSLVALPLGHPADLSLRARETLEQADLIFCEDTRRLNDLAARANMNLRAKLVSLPGDREREIDWKGFRENYASWALVSDAGTPIVNDPGAALLLYARAQGAQVRAIPGPSAPIMAWQWSGGFGVPFAFAGFVPKAKRAEAKELAEFFAPLAWTRTFVYFDTRHQALTSLEGLVALGYGKSRVFVAREMTKPHEELIEGDVEGARDWLRDRLESEEGIGELTFVVEGRHETPSAKFSLEELIRIRTAPTKEASKIMARLSGESARDCYDRLVAAKSGESSGVSSGESEES